MYIGREEKGTRMGEERREGRWQLRNRRHKMVLEKEEKMEEKEEEKLGVRVGETKGVRPSQPDKRRAQGLA